MAALRGEEEWVRQCLEAALPGAEVTQHDDGSAPSMHDLDVWIEDDRVGAVEVSAAVDSAALQLWKLVTKPDQWTDNRLVGGWIVTVSRTAQFRALKLRLPELLRTLELQGRRHLGQDLHGRIDAGQELADSLGIVSAQQSATDRPGSVYVLVGSQPEQSGGIAPDSADCVAEWLQDWLRRGDQRHNLDKLARSGARERHMAVLIAGVLHAPFDVEWALTSSKVALPSVMLDSPDEITHCWVMSTWSSGQGLVWSPDGWAFFDKLQPRHNEG